MSDQPIDPTAADIKGLRELHGKTKLLDHPEISFLEWLRSINTLINAIPGLLAAADERDLLRKMLYDEITDGPHITPIEAGGWCYDEADRPEFATVEEAIDEWLRREKARAAEAKRAEPPPAVPPTSVERCTGPGCPRRW